VGLARFAGPVGLARFAGSVGLARFAGSVGFARFAGPGLLARPSSCPERRFQDNTDVLKDAFGSLGVLNASFRTRQLS
jgi:hypothetical protein